MPLEDSITGSVCAYKLICRLWQSLTLSCFTVTTILQFLQSLMKQEEEFGPKIITQFSQFKT